MKRANKYYEKQYVEESIFPDNATTIDEIIKSLIFILYEAKIKVSNSVFI